MMENMSMLKKIKRYINGHFLETEDEVAAEFPLTIFLNGQEFATLVCTPSHFEEMVIGFLASEGAILFHNEIKSLNIDEGRGYAYVDLNKEISMQQDYFTKRFIGSCCGKSRQFYFHNDARTAKISTAQTSVTAAQCLHLLTELQKDSRLFLKTGGVHNAALCTADDVIISRSDIGRHNALDKLYGYCLIHKIPIRDKIIAFSGRISSEVLLKAAKIGVGIVLSKSAPTNLAIELAQPLSRHPEP